MGVIPADLLDAAVHLRADVFRNIVSIRVPQNLYDDLSASGEEWEAAIVVEVASKPRDAIPVLNRAFDDGYLAAIDYPFSHGWTATRFSDGTRYGVWYGSPQLETTVHETAHHFRAQLADSGFADRDVIRERKVYLVAADALVFDLRGKTEEHPALVAPADYAFTHEVGRAIATGGHPGLLTRSARCAGECVALFAARYLSAPRDHCFLTYAYVGATGQVRVQRHPGVDWMTA